ncbi:MAG: XrtN system VIT domain-containing protein, partial [Cytophagales bacterium]|nr:XrtN system VIT domain-containing protein [Cytophagales bacterium]
METNNKSLVINNLGTNENENKSIFIWGYGFLSVSFILYALTEYMELQINQDNQFAIFFGHYILSVVFAIIMLANGSFGLIKSWRKENIHYTIILFNLYLISAYALNRVLPVFENSVDWLCVLLIIGSLTLLSFRFFDRLSIWMNCIQFLILGVAILLYLYMTFYTAPYYPIGGLGMIFIGIGLHILIPILLLVCSVAVLFHYGSNNFLKMGFTTAGFLLSILFIVAFIIQWNSRISKIERLANQSVFSQEMQFPIWVKAGQVLENDWISERILKSNLVYTLSEEKFSEWRFMPDRLNWEERRKHDPLVFLASIFSTCTLTDLERVKILRCLSDSRHKSQERLWAGDNLSTSYIVTDVDIYSDLRISYTEKYLNIKNGDKRSSWWGNMEEAIYTFQLPEGSVVTSLSLWVNGKEEKAILTSKQKAAEAYKAIVGQERRDPSIVQWQEGNTVSVRVFPCTSEEERKFKIGITSPLSVVNGKLVYKDISFKGPNASNAKESRRISIIGSKDGISFPKEFTKDKRGNYISEGNYDENFQFSFDLKPIQPNAFHFKGNAYSIEQFVPKYHKVALENIYLDVNKSWSKEELDGVKPLMAKYKLYVSLEDGFVPLEEDNWSEIMDELATYNFSLFPFHDISDPQHSIVITKGKEFSPQLKDIKGSEFAEKIGSCFGKGNEIRVFNFGPTASTYIRS